MFLMQLKERSKQNVNSSRKTKTETFNHFNFELSNSTIWRRLHGLSYTKKINIISDDNANEYDILVKRQEYTLTFQQHRGEDKFMGCIVEISFKIFVLFSM